MNFARAFDQLPITSWRIVNALDVVPKLPPHIPLALEYDHVDTEFKFTSADFSKNSLVCWHCMETYLHWLDQGSYSEMNVRDSGTQNNEPSRV